MRKNWTFIVGGMALPLSLLSACQMASVRREGFIEAAACTTEEFAAMRLQREAAGSIVRITFDGGTGTGFAIKRRGRDLLIATNYHVISRAAQIDLILPSGARLSEVEVAKIDVEHDLALLVAPALGQVVPGLPLSSEEVVPAEPIASLGYPHVDGEREPSLTFEEGRVTNARTELNGQTYIRTNANINPGNSGGPVINACAQVVGIVVATHTETERTGLVIPVRELMSLLTAYDVPRRSPEEEIAARIASLEEAVHYQRGAEVAAMFTREFLSEKVLAAFIEHLNQVIQAANRRVDELLVSMKKKGTPYQVGDLTITNHAALPEDKRVEIQVMALSPDEQAEVLVAGLIRMGKVDAFTGMTAWLGQSAHQLFGTDPEFTLKRVVASSKKKAQSMVTIESAGSQQFWLFSWKYEWGDWRIESFACSSGCG